MRISEITFAGHSATFFRGEGTTIAIDPWLEGNPACPASLKTPARLDLIVLTHGHADHAGEAASLAKHHGSTIIAAWELAMILVNEGVPQNKVVPMNKGGTFEWNGLGITLTHAMHSSSYDTPTGALYAGEPCGIVLTDAVRSIYHAGDTALFNDMSLIREMYHPEIALLPIGDRFTMGPKEAAIAAKLIGAKTVIPIHYGTFDMLTGTVAAFRKACPAEVCKIVELPPGETYRL